MEEEVKHRIVLATAHLLEVLESTDDTALKSILERYKGLATELYLFVAQSPDGEVPRQPV